MPKIGLNGCNADVWAWQATLSGRTTGMPDGSPVRIEGGKAPVETLASGGTFSAEVQLTAGENHLRAVYDLPNGQQVESAALTYTSRLRRVPEARISPSLEGSALVLDGSASQAIDPETPIVSYTWSPRPNNPAAAELLQTFGPAAREFTAPFDGQQIHLQLPSQDGEYYFSLKVVDKAGASDSSTIYILVSNGQPRIPDYAIENPAWVENTVVYGVIPFLFGHKGFQSITDRLDDLQDLGINALWLAPINVSPADDYGYAVKDYFDLNKGYGTKDDFRTLIEAAHARGIRVLMDFVPNHTSAEHPYYRTGLQAGMECRYWFFYDRDETGMATHYFNWTHLPNLNYNNPEVERFMLEAFSYWVREFDVDGFRVDAAWGVRQRKPDFWPIWRQTLQRIRPDLLLLAEASARDPYYFDNGFDAAYDWTDQVGRWAWALVWESYKNQLLAYNLDYALTARPKGFHPDALVFRFLNNNDTGERFITEHGEAMTRVATAMLLTLPGIPCIYTGDEIGAWFEPYYAIDPIDWGDNRYVGLRDFHKQLIALRKEQPALHSRAWQRVEIQPVPQEVYGYLRTAKESGVPLLVLLNFSEEPAEISVSLPEAAQSFSRAGQLFDLLSSETIQPVFEGEQLRVALPVLSAMILSVKSG